MDNGNNNELTRPGIKKDDAPVHISVDPYRIGRSIGMARLLQDQLNNLIIVVDNGHSDVVKLYLDMLTVTVNELNEELEEL